MLDKQQLIDFELRIKDAWEAGQIKAPVHFCGGNEDQLIEIFKEIKRDDIVYSSHRNHYHALLHGVEPSDLYNEILAMPSSLCGGHARSMGFINHRKHFYSSAIVGGCCAIAVGTAWALKQEQDNNPLNIDEFATPPRHVWCFCGDGVVDGGHFWEAVAYAEGYKLPVTFCIEDNNRATCTGIKDRCGFAVGLREIIKGHPNVKWYYYEPTYPHVGSGKYVAF